MQKTAVMTPQRRCSGSDATPPGDAKSVSSTASTSTSSKGVSFPDNQTLRTYFFASMVPMVGFGFMDNVVMIQAGDLIDNSLGVKFGLATLTAAAFGQVISDVSGVCFGGFVDSLCTKLGLKPPNLTSEQRQLSSVRRIGTAGQAVGVVCGCLLGMSSLLFMDLEAAERAKKDKEFNTIFTTVILEGSDTLQAERATLFVVDSEKSECWSRTAVGQRETIVVPMDNSLVGACAKQKEVLHVKDAYKDARFNKVNDERTGFRTRNVLCIPVFGACHKCVTEEHDQEHHEESQRRKAKDQKVLAVVQLVNKRKGDFLEADIRAAKMLARHVGIFLEQVSEKD